MEQQTQWDWEHTPWPVLLLKAGEGVVLRANAAARSLFGAALEGERPRLEALGAEGGESAHAFLAGLDAAPRLAVLKFRAGGGGVKSFCALGARQGQGPDASVLLQLLPESAGCDSSLALKQKLDCALQLARSVALEFNNALTSVLGYTSLLLSRAEPGHPWRRTLLEVEKSAAKAAEVAADLAAFSLREKELRQQSAGNINTLVQRCVEFFQHSRKETVRWDLRLERQIFAARFDEAKLQQAVTKVLENAVEALRQDGRIAVQTRNVELSEPAQDCNARLAAGLYVCIEIADNGCGIEPDVMPRIFEPFFTTKKGVHRGLGLAWVYGILTNHGGAVAVSSQPGVGTSVRLYLPAERTVMRASAPEESDLTGNQTILMVDDEDLLLTMGETILSAYGYHVLTANSGPKALEILSKSEKPIDLLITDLVMPIMSGRELVEQVRRLSPQTRIITTSGYVWPGEQPEHATYLQKPFTTQELLMKVKQVLAAG
jgi:signal transduction histidine kinase